MLLLSGALFIANAPIAISANDNDLGLSVRIVPGDSSKSGLESNDRLWFVVAPGESKTRKFIVQSTSGIDQEINLSIGAVDRINGKSVLVNCKESETKDWVTFSNNNFVLAPRSSQEVELTFNIPASQEINSFSALLLVRASSANKQKTDALYSVPGAAQIAAPIFLGVGTKDEFVTKFEISDVSGVNTSEGKAVRVEIKNIGICLLDF